MNAQNTVCINASGWTKFTCQHMEVYSPNADVITLLKQQDLRHITVMRLKAIFRIFYKPFACFIVNQKTQTFFLLRDHFGFEPFYYVMPADASQTLCFGSSLPDVLAHMKNPVLDKQQVSDTLMDACIGSLEYTDHTYYQHVFRVTPGHVIQNNTKSNPREQRHVFWDLKPGTSYLRYASDADYDAHFEVLLQEACETCCEQAPDDIALEFSGGLDSSSILTALNQLNITPQLLMHAGEISEERHYGEQLVQELELTSQLHYINADDFDVLAVLDLYKTWFAGGAPYLFFMFASNIHQAVRQKKCKILLSGFGGDECVSSHALLRTYGAEVGFKALWPVLKAMEPNTLRLRRLYQTFLYAHPKLYYALQKYKPHASVIARERALVHYRPYTCLQAREASWLTGPLSHHIRMRIEYSAVVAKQMGFTYQYPLLYPPLVEYCFALPPEQKRRLGQNRLLMRKYLAKHVPSGLFNTHKKCGGIFPGTLPKCQEQYNRGAFQQAFAGLPYIDICDEIVKQKRVTEDRMFHIDALRYMFEI